MEIKKELLEELLKDHPKPEDVIGENGTMPKTLKGEFGEMVIETPRDRNGSFEPQMVKKHHTRWDGFDDRILSMYARGMTTREIQGHLREQCRAGGRR